MFVDEVVINVEAGKGGDGCTSFRREKYVDMGGPNGGNGGKGSSVIFKTEPGLKTLIDLKMMKHIKADKGVNGKGSNMNGSNATDLEIKVPCGTTVTNVNTGDVIADLVKPGESVVVARGGRGGLGNAAFATHDNPAPRMSELGELGEKIRVKCELKVLADVGLVGFPSVGKTTLINMISNAGAKTGAYHFTTLNPNLGVVKNKQGDSFVMADLPGMIEGASEGIGLGIKFLKHAMRTKIIAHVVDMGALELTDPIESYETIKNEMEKYDKALIEKPSVIIASKMDLPDAEDNLVKFKAKYPNEKIFPISSINNQGLEELVNYLCEEVKKLDEVKLYEDNEKLESHILYKFNQEKPFTVTKQDNGVWLLTGREVETLFLMTRFNEDESVQRFGRKLKGMGVDKELERLGAERGDDVQIFDYIFEWKD